MHSNAEVMIPVHVVPRVEATEIQVAAENILEDKERLNQMLADNVTGKPYEVVAEDTERDHWMSAEEALDYGLIDGIIHKERVMRKRNTPRDTSMCIS